MFAKIGSGTFAGAMQSIINKQDERISELEGLLRKALVAFGKPQNLEDINELRAQIVKALPSYEVGVPDNVTVNFERNSQHVQA